MLRLESEPSRLREAMVSDHVSAGSYTSTVLLASLIGRRHSLLFATTAPFEVDSQRRLSSTREREQKRLHLPASIRTVQQVFVDQSQSSALSPLQAHSLHNDGIDQHQRDKQVTC